MCFKIMFHVFSTIKTRKSILIKFGFWAYFGRIKIKAICRKMKLKITILYIYINANPNEP